MALLRYGDELLRVDGGLTEDPNCCCNGDPPPGDCPDCCLRITSGTLIGGQIKIFVTAGDYAMDVTITTPSGTRVVCDGESITVNFLITAPVADDALSADAFATWDQIWRRTAFTPSTLGTNSSDNKYGHVFWGNSGTGREFSVTLELAICHAIADPFAGLITVGSVRWPALTTDIEVQICSLTGTCCNKDPVCEPCCFTLSEAGGWVWNTANTQWEQYTEGIGFGVLAVVNVDADGLVCLNDEVEITLYIVSKSRDWSVTATFSVEMVTSTWPLTITAGNAPARAPGYKGAIQWTASTAKSYTIRVAPVCGEPAEITWSVQETITVDTVIGSAVFLECNPLEGCLCCCPDYCCGDCHFPVTEDACEVLDPIYGYDDHGGPTQIANLVANVTVTPDGFCPVYDEFGFTGVYESDTGTFAQQGLSVHKVVCENVCPTGTPKLCAHSACYFIVSVKETNCTYSPEAMEFGEGLPFPITVVYNGAGDWGIGSGGAGWIWWVTGRTSYSGDCNGATASGTFVSGPYTYNWTTTFTVTRVMPPDAPICPLPEVP